MLLRSLIILLSLGIFSSTSQADDEVGAVIVSIEEGDVAPFNGTLFSTRAAADVLVQLENQDAACQIRIDREVGLREAELNLQIERAEISANACQERYDMHMDIKREEVNFLYDRLRRASGNKNALWFGVGTASGIGMTALSVWILNSISSSAN
jgi:2-phosphoglycerate kinase